MEPPLISILVPIYNVEPYIERCTRSLFEQTYDNLEFVFVDDCTPDKSIQILETVIADYHDRAKQTRIIHHDHNRGCGVARNTLIDNSNGDFLFFVDSDDWIEPYAIELLVKKQQETKADIVTGCCKVHSGEKKENNRELGWNLDKVSLLSRLCRHQCSSVLWGRIIRKNLYDSVSCRCWDYGDDFVSFTQLLYYAQSISGINDVVYHYNRENATSLTDKLKNSLELQLQYLYNHQLVSEFFSGRDSNYQRICDETAVWMAYRFMVEWGKRGNKEGYKAMKDILNINYQIYHSLLGWDNSLKKAVANNYWLFYCYLTLRNMNRK